MPSLLDRKGNRKYLSPQEREGVLKAAEKFPREIKTLIGVLIYTGCRISEALALTADRVDLDEGLITFETMKQRKKGIFRSVPVPPKLLSMLDLVHSIRETSAGKGRKNRVHLWKIARTIVWRKIKDVIHAAGIEKGPQVTPKGFRRC